MTEPFDEDDVALFLATLGAALGAIGETVDAVETRLARIARSYGLRDARFSVFPTFLLLTLGQGGDDRAHDEALADPAARPDRGGPPARGRCGARRGRTDHRRRAARDDSADGQPLR